MNDLMDVCKSGEHVESQRGENKVASYSIALQSVSVNLVINPRDRG